MKKLYSIMLAAVALLGISFSGHAQRSTTITWDIPGSIEIRMGSISAEPVELDPNATSYVASTDETYGSVYLFPKKGYILINGTCSGTHTNANAKTIKPGTNANGQYLSINMGTGSTGHNDHTVHALVDKLEYDGKCTINLVSAGDVKATFGTREIKLNGGAQEIAFSTKYENKVVFSATATGASDPYIKKNDEVIEWKALYGKLTHAELTAANNDKFEVKWNDEPPVVVEPAKKFTVTVNYADDMAKKAVSMIFNKTQKKSISYSAVESFEVEEGDIVQFTFNTKDYTISVNDKPISGEGETTVWLTDPINDNTTVAVSAAEREYANTNISIAIQNPEGVILRAGSIDGPVIDLTEYTPTASTDFGTEFQQYTIPVSLKSPKIFVSEAPGWYINKSGYGNPNTDNFEEALTARNDVPLVLHVWTHKIEKDTRLVVYVKGTLTAARLKDQHNNSEMYPLQLGYNEFMIDPVYSGAFTVQPILSSEQDKFAVYTDYSAAAIDDNGVYSGITVNKDCAIHIFAGVPASKLHTYTVTNAAEQAPEITFDRVLKATEPTFTVFTGSEVSVKPAEGYILKIDDEKMPLTDGAYSFTQSGGNLASHTMDIVSPAVMEISPANGATIEEFDGVTIAFPNADKVTFDPEVAADEVTVGNNMWAAVGGWDIAAVEGADCPTYKFTLKNNTMPSGRFTINVYEGFFTINDTFKNATVSSSFTLNKPVSLEWTAEPEGDVVASEYFGPNVAFSYGYDANVSANYTDEIPPVKVIFNDNALTYGTGYKLMLEGGFIMFALDEVYKNQAGTLTISIPAETFLVNGQKTPAMAHTWNVVMPKVYEVNVTPNFELDALTPADEPSFTIEFANAESAEVYNQNLIYLRDNTYQYNNKPASITAVESAQHPTFTLTFPAIGKEMKEAQFTLSLYDGAFTLDGVQSSPAIDKKYTLTIADKNVQEYVLTPANGEKVKAIESLTIAFPNARTVTFNGEEGMTNEIMLRDQAWSFYTEFFTVVPVADAAVPTFTLTPDKAAKANGSYSLLIGAGVFTINGTATNEDIAAAYTIDNPITVDDLVYSIYPVVNSEIENLYDASVSFSFPTGFNINMETFDGEKIAAAFQGQALVPGDDFTADSFNNILDLTVMKSVFEKKNGTLTVTLQEGWCKFGEVLAPAVSGSWKVIGETSGISDIFGDGVDAFTVVTIDGRVILVDAPASALKQLASGLYIINGEKVYLSK